MQDAERLVDKFKAAAILDVSPRSLADIRWRLRQGLRAVRIGRSIRFRLSDLHQLSERGLERLPGEGRR